MAFRSFRIEQRRGVRLVEATDFPNLAVIAGPNGSGKSTLLYELHAQRSTFAEPGTEVAYLGPHRSWRRTTLGLYALGEVRSSLNEYLRELVVPSFRQYQPPSFQYVQTGVQRDHTGPDESFSFVKASILKIDFRLQNRLRDVWQAEGQKIEPGRVPNIFQPLTEAVRALLPHLEFVSADFTDEASLYVYFRRVDGQYDDRVEIDDLSSGEKSAIGVILPTVERRIAQLLGDEAAAGPLPTTLIDEPESHLHPSLQVLLLDYLQGLAADGQAQFILSTHSPTIVDSLTDGLYLLAPSAQVPDGNQLLPLGSEAARLDAMRALTGATHLLTRCRPIVYLEGERPSEKPISDQRLVEMLVPEAPGWVLVSARGQREVVGAAEKLREAVAETIPGLAVFALVDADQHQAADPDWVVPWPVSMVENLLLDPEAIWEVLESHREAIGLRSVDDVRDALNAIAAAQTDDEVRLRMPPLHRVISTRIRPADRDDIEEALARAHGEVGRQLEALQAEALQRAWDDAASDVERIVSEGRMLEAFRGKPIFDAFFDDVAKRAGLAKKAFAYAVASRASTKPRCQRLVGEAVKRITTYVPSELVEAARALGEKYGEGPHGDELLAVVQELESARVAWEGGSDLPITPEALRDRCVALARLAESAGEHPLAEQIRRGTARLAARTATG